MSKEIAERLIGMTPEEELVTALMEAAVLLQDARPPEGQPYAWIMSREAWMERQRIRLIRAQREVPRD